MFGTASRYGAPVGAGARYRDVDVSARVEGASPHQLISILFEELLKAIDALVATEKSNERGRAGPQQSRALSILHGLEQGLDFDKGGEIAMSLGKIYREARRLIGQHSATDRLGQLQQARSMVADVASAWMSIG